LRPRKATPELSCDARVKSGFGYMPDEHDPENSMSRASHGSQAVVGIDL